MNKILLVKHSRRFASVFLKGTLNPWISLLEKRRGILHLLLKSGEISKPLLIGLRSFHRSFRVGVRTLPSCASQSLHAFKFMITLVAFCIVQCVKPMGKEHSHDVGPDSSHASSPTLYFGDVPTMELYIAPFIWIMDFFNCACSKKDNNFKNPFGLWPNVDSHSHHYTMEH